MVFSNRIYLYIISEIFYQSKINTDKRLRNNIFRFKVTALVMQNIKDHIKRFDTTGLLYSNYRNFKTAYEKKN